MYAGDIEYGRRLENGSFTGVLGMIQRGVSLYNTNIPACLVANSVANACASLILDAEESRIIFRS